MMRVRCLEHLKGLPRLRKIDTNTDYPGEELSYIGELTNLETLEVRYTELADPGLTAIQGMTGLKRLSLHGNRYITDVGLEYLAHLTSLEDLDLSNTHVCGTGLQWLTRLAKFKKLNLCGSHLADAQVRVCGGLCRHRGIEPWRHKHNIHISRSAIRPRAAQAVGRFLDPAYAAGRGGVAKVAAEPQNHHSLMESLSWLIAATEIAANPALIREDCRSSRCFNLFFFDCLLTAPLWPQR